MHPALQDRALVCGICLTAFWKQYRQLLFQAAPSLTITPPQCVHCYDRCVVTPLTSPTCPRCVEFPVGLTNGDCPVAPQASWAQAQQPTAKQRTTGAAPDAASSQGRVGSPGRAVGHGRGAPSQSQGVATAAADNAVGSGQRLPGPVGGAASRVREPTNGSHATASGGVPADGTASAGTVNNRSTSGKAASGQSRAGPTPAGQPQPPSSSLTSAISRGVTAAPGTAPPNAWTGASRPAHPGAPLGVTSAGAAARSAAAAALGRSPGASSPSRGGGAPSGVLPPVRPQALGSGAPLTQAGLREHTRSASGGGARTHHSRVTQSAFQNGQAAVQSTVQGRGSSRDSAGGNGDGNGGHVGKGNNGIGGGDRHSRRTSTGVKLARPQPVAFGATGLAARTAPKKQVPLLLPRPMTAHDQQYTRVGWVVPYKFCRIRRITPDMEPWMSSDSLSIIAPHCHGRSSTKGSVLPDALVNLRPLITKRH